jgi:hypothetical protein
MFDWDEEGEGIFDLEIRRSEGRREGGRSCGLTRRGKTCAVGYTARYLRRMETEGNYDTHEEQSTEKAQYVWFAHTIARLC